MGSRNDDAGTAVFHNSDEMIEGLRQVALTTRGCATAL
jgi:hypothetical protein